MKKKIVNPKEEEEKLANANAREETTRKGLKFSIIDGDGPTRNEIWLANLKPFCVFLSREKSKLDRSIGRLSDKSIDLREYHVLNKYKRATKLKMIIPGSSPIDLFVENVSFSLAMELVEILYEGEG